jgi:hypothetical protein
MWPDLIIEICFSGELVSIPNFSLQSIKIYKVRIWYSIVLRVVLLKYWHPFEYKCLLDYKLFPEKAPNLGNHVSVAKPIHNNE